ncbi:myo-inosose-2 dehydratase [Benzoatithermus flavus]|uniref:Myo-inosose-2 dehydratase n=1 Tax=Benzoatithermus flavus TaxID=3108223 RepID=A0ABU8XP94_9PROT
MQGGKAPSDALRLGVSPLSWVNEVLEELGRGTTAATCLSEAAAAGYAGVELSRIFPREPAALSRLLSAHGLRLASGWYSGFLADREVEAELEAVRAHAGLLRACGVEVMVYGECGRMAENALDVPMSARLRLAPEEVAAYGDRLTRFAEALRDVFGLALAYHHHLMMVAETFEEIRAVMAATGPAVGLLLDTGHAAAAGFDHARLIEAFGPRINHIHLKDVRADVLAEVRARDLSFNDAVRAGMFTVPGDGAIDFGPLARFLGEGRYAGWLVVEAEQDPMKAPPAATVARAHGFVAERILQSASRAGLAGGD